MRLTVTFIFIISLAFSSSAFAQKTWEDDGVTITKLDTLAEGYEALRGSFIIENTSIYEVMNLILDVDGYDWVEGESTTKMLEVNQQDSSFTFDFFVSIPWLFVKKTGRVKVDVGFAGNSLFTKSTQIKAYKRDKDYDPVDFYSAQWKLEKLNHNDVKVTYLGVYQDVKMVLNINSMVIKRIRKRLNSTFHNLKKLASNKREPANALIWPTVANKAQVVTQRR